MKKSDLEFKRCCFGTLYYHNVYSFYDQPIIFSALNEYDQIYFCYSLGCDDTHDRWLITPVSAERANKLEQKSIPIIDVIKQTGQSRILVLKEDLETGQILQEEQKSKNLPFLLPNNTIFISENINVDGKRKHTHRIRIAKNNNNDIVSETLNEVSEAFSRFCKNYLKNFDLSSQFFAKDALAGSFVYRVKADNLEEFKTKGYEALIKISSKEEFIEALDNKDIDLRTVHRLFSLILSNKLNIQLIDEESTEPVVDLTHQYVEELIEEVSDRLGTYLDSTMVPQADSLERLKLYLQILEQNGFVTSELLNMAPRQVSYYRDACEILGLIHDYSKLTPIGAKALHSPTEQEYINVIQRQFEETECGFLWMRNQNVNNIVDINEETATEFLIHNCNGLSDSTSSRRAQTLKAWVRKFKEFV
ncbi:DUF6575 domain-containing protein [Methylophaga sp.]|uniref:DUF6575 domain-containing protein n=1 Tax=Methylophaga sp. TaxID=2024840 RepID=UPI002728EBA1|nr:DUF6575 domain-containing protein [Methylophaga sp.]MDO8826973.1 hypothetical protein [Methylophaga sp.]